MIYLDAAATTLEKPPQVRQAMAQAAAELSTPGRGSHPAARRAEESRLSMDLMSANCALALTTAKKLAGMHTNGDVEEAMEAARTAQESYQAFLQRQAADQVSKV